MTRIVIRRVEPADAEQCRQVFMDRGAYSGTLQLPHPSIEMWSNRLSAPDANRHFLVALIDGAIVGTGALHCEPNLRRRHAAGIGMAVADNFSGQGVGTALMEELVSFADNWLGMLRLELTVFTDNVPAVALYRKFGFEREGTLRSYALRNGTYADVDSMARLHPQPPKIHQ